jgi:hypothetical protein
MATKEEVADFINNFNMETLLSSDENAYVQERVDPKLATILIKLVGDVSWLVDIRDNLPRE